MSKFTEHECYSGDCPSCGIGLTRATGLDLDSEESPEVGDFSVCIHCGEYLRFNEDLSMRKATPADLDMLLAQQPQSFSALSLAHYMVLQGNFGGAK